MLLKLMLFSKESQLLPNWVLCEWQFIKERKAAFWATATVLYLASTDRTCLCTEWSAIWHGGSGFHVPAPKRPRGDLESFSLLCTDWAAIWISGTPTKVHKPAAMWSFKESSGSNEAIKQTAAKHLNKQCIHKEHQPATIPSGWKLPLSWVRSRVWATCYMCQQFILWLGVSWGKQHYKKERVSS